MVNRKPLVARLAAVLVAAIVILAPSAAHAVILAEDHFLTSATPTGPEYSLGVIAAQNPSNLGFSGPWDTSVSPSSTVESASLNYADANYPDETGGRMLSPTSNSRVHRLLASSTNPFEPGATGTVYLSFLFQTAFESFSFQDGYRAFEMHYNGTSDADHRTLQIGVSRFTDFPSREVFGLRVNNDDNLEYSLGSRDENVHLFLAKFDLSATPGGDMITVWNNPDISDLESDPDNGVVAMGFDFAADRLGAGHFSGATYSFDELRIGTTLVDVLSDFLYCDINGNGVCNSTDIGIISDNLFLPGTFEDGDIDGSGLIDHLDFRLFKDHPDRVVGFDPEGAASLAIPEPACAMLVGIASLMCVGFGRRRARARFVAFGVPLLLVAIALTCAGPAHAAEQDLLNDALDFSGKTLHIRQYAPAAAGFSSIIGIAYKPSDTRMYFPTEQGSIFVVNEDSSGNTSPELFFNASAALQTATGRQMNFSSGQQGLQAVAFHPNFEKVGQPGYGKLYTTMLENRPGNPGSSEFFYLGNSTYGGGGADGVLAEWTYSHETGEVDPNSYRELFRTNMPNYDHPIKHARFNPYAEPGDDDYGLLYLTHGDSNNQDSLNDDPQDRGDVLGKMLRINPLQSDDDRYTIPTINPFYSGDSPTTAGTLGEVYAYGFRNPHTFSFNQDDANNTHILVGDIGRDNVEEVNLVVAGGNYGWTKREGTFVHLQGSNSGVNAGYISGVDDLQATEVNDGIGPDGNRYIYPVAQYDHNGPGVNIGAGYVSQAVASGFVIRNGSDPDLDNQFIFNNFGGDTGGVGGPVFHVDFDEVLNAVTQLDPGDTDRDHPDELTQALVQRLHLAFDHDNNPGTAPQMYDDLNDLLGANRNDARYGEGISGEMYISSKRGAIYLVTNTVPDNRLTLTVDRGTGEMTITNSTGSNIEIDRVAVYSPTGALLPGPFQSLDTGWTVAAENSTRSLTQSVDPGSFELTGANSAFLGAPHNPELVAFDEPPGEDVQFVFTTSGPSGRDFVGDVEYVGESSIYNTIVMSVNLATGEAVLLNRTPFSQEVELYTVTSPSDSLNTGEWNTFEDQSIDDGDWLASPPLPGRLSELQEDGTTTFDDASSYSLGNIFQGMVNQDLTFEFLLAGESTLREGRVVYFLPGDYNGDGVVDAADYTVWRDSMGAAGYRLAADGNGDLVVDEDDYTVWVSNFGQTWPGAAAASADVSAVPEPAGCTLMVIAAMCLVRRRPRVIQHPRK